MTVAREQPAVARLVERFTQGHDRHCQRWQLHVPCEGEPFAAARPLLLVLGLPTFGLAFAISVLTTYGPVVLIHLTNSTSQVGALIGGEGAFALAIPLISGALSDRLPGSPATRRFPFILSGGPLVVAGLALLAFSGSVALAAAAPLHTRLEGGADGHEQDRDPSAAERLAHDARPPRSQLLRPGECDQIASQLARNGEYVLVGSADPGL